MLLLHLSFGLILLYRPVQESPLDLLGGGYIRCSVASFSSVAFLAFDCQVVQRLTEEWRERGRHHSRPKVRKSWWSDSFRQEASMGTLDIRPSKGLMWRKICEKESRALDDEQYFINSSMPDTRLSGWVKKGSSISAARDVGRATCQSQSLSP